jgi:glycosyltransferase involved in cell wall biosynthesis
VTHEEWNNASWLARPAIPIGERPVSRQLRLAVSKQLRAPVVLHARVVAGHGGGPDKTIFRSARHIDRSRYTIAAAYLHPRGDRGMATLREQAEAQHCPLWQIEECGPLDLRAVRRMLALVRELKVTIWHAHDYKSDVLGLLLRRFWPMKLVTTVHGFTRETARTRLYARIDNRVLPRYDRIVAVSPALYDHCLRIGVPEANLHYVPNAIDAREFQRGRSIADARRLLDIDTDAVVMGCVGRLSKEKGVGRAIRTLARLRKATPMLQLHLFGDGPDRPRLQAMVRELKLGDRVRFHGWQRDTRPCFEALDMLLLPSRTEGMPNTVLEAMAMGVPVAATDVGGVRELLHDGRCGVILNQHETDWVGPILGMLRDASGRAELASHARSRIESLYTYEHRFQRIAAIYDDLLRIPRHLDGEHDRTLRQAA